MCFAQKCEKVYVCVIWALVVFFPRYRWAFIPEASDDSGLEVRRQGTHQREFKPYVVRLAKLLRKRAKVTALVYLQRNIMQGWT